MEKPAAEAESGEIAGTVLREPLRQDDAADQQVQEVMIDDTEEGDAGQPKAGAEGEISTIPSDGSGIPPSELKSDFDKIPPTASERIPEPPKRRNVTALGVLVSAVLLVMVFAAGYVISNVLSAPSHSDNQRSPQNNLGSKPEVGTSGGTTLSSDDPGEEQPIVRAPENPISLNKLFLRNIGTNDATYVEEDIVVGRQLFSHYVNCFTNEREAVPAYKLDGQFQKVTCVVGVADEQEVYFSNERRRVLFEGDGKVLKQLDVEPGQAVAVSLQVKDIKVLMISFRFPVVIASPKAHR
ncbi:MAG: hypothetical protein M3R13_11475 [Armatimonadota bacterium]|nr:hypothetical protein [Armatimonadota bacterium]